MLTNLDRESDVPLYLQIRDQIRDLVLSGDLPLGARLPPERQLAAALGVNRTTISNAYHELAADGLVEGQVGRGTIVCSWPHSGTSELESTLSRPLHWNEYFVEAQARNPLVRELIALCAQEDVISLAGAVPAPDLYPIERFAQAVDTVLRRHGRTLLQYGPTEGDYRFRETLSERAAERGIVALPENVLVLSGSQQGLDLIARAMIGPGTAVVVESPSYLGALDVFRAAGARLLSVPVDGEGMRVDLLERLLARHRPQLIYTLPTFQNPSGQVMSARRRQALLSLAEQYQVPVLEDDPYSELYYRDPPPPPVKSLDRQGHVIYLSTFSKILLPGIRIGWLVAPRPVVDRLASIKQHADLNSNTLAQWALVEFIGQGWLDEHLDTLRRAYPHRLAATLSALREYVPRGMRWNEPAGGLHLWCHLEGRLRTRDLLAEATRRRVAFVAGEAFHADGGGGSALRLNFTYPSEEDVREGVRRLGEAMAVLMGGQEQRHTLQPETARPIV
jgi:DNA-binding transcriptional MocR family regulator